MRLLLFLIPLGAWAQTPASLKLTLPAAEALAVKQHPQLAASHYFTLATGEIVRETAAAQKPQVTANATAVGALDNSRLAAGFLNAGNLLPRAAAGIAVQQLVTDFGRTRDLVASSKLREQAQTANETSVRANVLLEVDREYFRALRAEALVRVAQETVRARQTVSDQIGELARQSLKSGLDVSFARVNLADAQLLEETAKNELAEAIAALSAALGFPAAQNLEISEPLSPAAPVPDPSSLLADAIRERPDLQALRLDRDANRKFADAERELNRPTISAAGAVGGIPAHTSALDDRYGAAGVNVSIPVFNGSLFAARRNEAELRAKASQERLRDAESQVARDVRNAWLDLSTAYRRIGLTQELLEQANQALDLAQARYDLGLSSIVELSQAQLGKTSAEIQSLTARYDFQLQNSVLRYQAGALR
jgi:outer membrane protein